MSKENEINRLIIRRKKGKNNIKGVNFKINSRRVDNFFFKEGEGEDNN
jgi:hypothetical protein